MQTILLTRSNTCLSSSDDGVVPDYMLMNQSNVYPLRLQNAVKDIYSGISTSAWVGSSPDSSVSGANKWYVKWVDSFNVQCSLILRSYHHLKHCFFDANLLL